MISVNQMAIYHTLLEAFNIQRNSASEQIQSKWSKIQKNDYSLRSLNKMDLKVPERPKARCMNFTYYGSKLFNSLPSNIKEAENSNVFKSWIKNYIWKNIPSYHRESVAGSVIQATGTVEFEDGLRTGVLPGGCWYPCGGRTYPRINSAPPGGCGLVMGAVWLSKGPLSDQIPVLPSSVHGWY